MAVLIFGPRIYVADENGEPIVGARLYTLATGTSTPVTTYANAIATVPHANPILSLAGGYFPAIYAKPSLGALKFRLFSYDPLTLTETNLGLDTDPAYSPLTVTDLITTSNDLAQLLESLDITEAETASNVTPTHFAFGTVPYDVRRVGVVANDTGAATLNTAALQALFDPTVTGITGPVVFPNGSGSDIYYFNDVLVFRDGIHIDLCGSTLNFAKTPASPDDSTGFLYAVRDFSCVNGSVVVDYDSTGRTAAGTIFKLGNRGSSGLYFPNSYDSLLDTPMGNIRLADLRLTSNNPDHSGMGIELSGGLQNVVFENIVLDGQDVLARGIYYEFGFATNNANETLRETSHMHNAHFRNVRIINLNSALTNANAMTLAGAYNCTVDGFYVNGAYSVFVATPGESLFYRRWVDVDNTGGKHTIRLRNIVGMNLTGTALVCTGQSDVANSYLDDASPALTEEDQTDLLDFDVDGAALTGVVGGWGIRTSAAQATIRNVRMGGFQRGIVTDNECTSFLIEACKITGCTQYGIHVGFDQHIYATRRLAVGTIQNCFIAGNSTSAAGTYSGITAAYTTSLLIENNRFGYEVIHDNVAETLQGEAISVSTTASGVVCRGNYVAAVTSPATNAYGGNATSTGCVVLNARGVVTATANVWQGDIDNTFTATLTGGTTSPTGTVHYIVHNGRVTMSVPSYAVTSNATTKTLTGMPAHMRPASTKYFTYLASDAGSAYIASSGSIATTGVITLYASASDGAWTASGSAAIRPLSVNYTLA